MKKICKNVIHLDFKKLTREEAVEIMTLLGFTEWTQSFFLKNYDPLPENPQLCILVDKLPWV